MKTTRKAFDCIRCDEADLQSRPVELSGVVRGETYTVRMQGLECPKCGYKTIEGPDMPEYGRLLADKYREAHGLLTSEAIRARRKRLLMTQEEFAKLLGVGIASVKRWEMGKIQDARSNQLIIERTDFPLGTHTSADYTCTLGGESSTFQYLNAGVIIVGTSVIDPNPEPKQFTVIGEYVTSAMEMTLYQCGECKQTASPSVIITAPDHQTVPPYIASLFNHSQERFSNARRK